MSTPNTEHNPDNEEIAPLIQIRICQPCLDGVGKECHTPTCALYLHRVDLPIARELYEVIEPTTPDTGKAEAQPASEGQQPAEAMPETETPENAAPEQTQGDCNENCERHITCLKRRLTSALTEVERLRTDIAHAVSEGEAYVPEYPWSTRTASEVAWALGQSVKGIELANGDLHKELEKLRAQLSTERAAREQAEKNYKEAQQEIADAIGKAVKEHVERCNAERERDSLATRLAESESREHQAREALEKAKKQVGHAFWICEHLAAEEPINTPREWQAQAGAFASTMEEIERSISAPPSTTVADLRKDRERLDWLETKRWGICNHLNDDAERVWMAWDNDTGDDDGITSHPTLRAAIDAALATTQETK